MTRKLTVMALCFMLGLAFGIPIGNAAAGLTVATTSPIGLNLMITGDPFTRAFAEAARLGEAEAALRCATGSQSLSSQQALLGAESDLIGALGRDAKSAGLEPPLDIATAILETRKEAVARLNGGKSRDKEELAGWPDDSKATLRMALAKLDGQLTKLNGGCGQ